MTERPPLLLLSKLAAGGLSAGVVLVWWPVLPHSSGAGSWVLRGIIWTCLFELLVLALGPLEQSLLESKAWVSVRAKLGTGLTVGNRGAIVVGLVMLLACAGLVWRGPVPSPAKPIKPQVEVKKIIQPVQIVRQTKVIEKTVPSKPRVIIKKETVTITKQAPSSSGSNGNSGGSSPKTPKTPSNPSAPKTPKKPSTPTTPKTPSTDTGSGKNTPGK